MEVRCGNGTVYYLDVGEHDVAARSPFFAALVGSASGMRDARVVCAEGDAEHVGVLVSYLQKGRLPAFLCTADALAILGLADFYGAEGLVAHCLCWLQYEVREDTALRVLVAVTRVPTRGGCRAETRAAALRGRALGAGMRTDEFLSLDEAEVQSVLCHPAMVPFVRQLRLVAWLAWAGHAGRALPPAAAHKLEALPLSVVGAMLQRADVQASADVVGALGAGLVVEPGIGMRSNEIDFAILVFDPSGRVFAIDLRTREAHEARPVAGAAWGKAVAAAYDHETGAVFVFGLDRPVDPHEYFPESGVSRRIPAPETTKTDAAYVCHDGYVYCIGGSTAEREYTSTVARMRTGSGRWEECAPMLAPRSAHDAAVVYGKTGAGIVAVGGTESRGAPPVERLDRVWRECDAVVPQMHARSVAVVESDVYVVGGYSHEGRGAFVFDSDGGTMTRVDEIASAPCQRAVAVHEGETSQVWVFEACSGPGPNVQVYDPVTRTREDLRVPEFTRGSAAVFVPRAAPGR